MLQVLEARPGKPEQKPQDGNLFDFAYLPCAAAYADVPVAEPRMIAAQRKSREPPARAALVTNLVDARAAIEPLLT